MGVVARPVVAELLDDVAGGGDGQVRVPVPIPIAGNKRARGLPPTASSPMDSGLVAGSTNRPTPLLRSSVTSELFRLATARSTSPSPSSSAATIDSGLEPVATGLVPGSLKLPLPRFRRRVTLSSLKLATARSWSPSSSRSAATIDSGDEPASSGLAGNSAKRALPLLRRMVTSPEALLGTARSLSPSPSRSAAATACGLSGTAVGPAPEARKSPVPLLSSTRTASSP